MSSLTMAWRDKLMMLPLVVARIFSFARSGIGLFLNSPASFTLSRAPNEPRRYRLWSRKSTTVPVPQNRVQVSGVVA